MDRHASASAVLEHWVSAGLIFGKYQVLRRLAVGGMGEIHIARQTGVPGFERLVILKSLRQDLAEDEHSIQAFLDEARIAALVSHPNVVQIFEVGKWEGAYFLAMEYIRGESVAGMVKAALQNKTWFPLGVSLQIMNDAAVGLDYAHHAKDMSGAPLNIVHRDISPQNIMVSLEGVTKLVDFGIAKAANREAQTATGVIKGKIRYMPPEQLRGEQLDARADQFALGVVFWELLTGKRLFGQVKSESEMLRTLESVPIPAPSSVNPELPPAVDAVLMPMLALDAAARYPRCLEFASRLREVLGQNVRTAGNAEVAHFVESLCGDTIRSRTQETSKTKDNFLISFSDLPQDGLEALAARDTGATLRVPGATGAVPGVSTPPRGRASRDLITDLPPPLDGQAVGWSATRANATPTPLQEPISGPLLGAETSESRPLSRPRTRTPRSAQFALALAAIVGFGGATGYLLRAGRPQNVSATPAPETAPNPAPVTAAPPPEAPPEPAILREVEPKPTPSPPESEPAREDVPSVAGAAVEPPKMDSTESEPAPRAAGTPRAERPSRRARSDKTSKPSSAATAGKPDTGLLTLNSTPWAQVTINGRSYGSTPIFKLALPVGSHAIQLFNEEEKVRKEQKITIRAGEVTKLNIDLKR